MLETTNKHITHVYIFIVIKIKHKVRLTYYLHTYDTRLIN